MLGAKLRITKWVLTLSALILLIAFVYSSRRAVTRVSQDLRHEYSLQLGQILFAWRPSGWNPAGKKFLPQPGWRVANFAGELRLRWGFDTAHTQHYEGFAIPIWPFLLIVSAFAVSLWYRDRRSVWLALQRLSNRFRPRMRLRLTICRVAVACVAHFVILAIAFWMINYLTYFFIPWEMRKQGFTALYLKALGFLQTIFLLGMPGWGLLWAWLYVKWRNRLLMSHPAFDCVTCGYDLTGNVTGICSECGQELLPAQVEQARPHHQTAARGSRSL